MSLYDELMKLSLKIDDFENNFEQFFTKKELTKFSIFRKQFDNSRKEIKEVIESVESKFETGSG